MSIIRPVLNRRQLLSLGAGGLCLPRRVLATNSDLVQERKFLFILCNGGWDPTFVFSDGISAPYVDTETDAVIAESNGLRFVDHPDRPGVKSFFENWGDHCAIINGMEVQSITHDRCLRLVHTGFGDDSADDWGSQLAAASTNDLLLPYVLISGFSFTASLTSQIVRMGPTGQLHGLVTGNDLTDQSDLPVALPSAESEELVHAYVQSRLAEYETRAGRGRAQRWGTQHSRIMEQLPGLHDYTHLMQTGSLNGTDLPSWSALSNAVQCLSTGLSRCAMVKYEGRYSAGWDTHSDNDFQSFHFMDLFAHLNVLMENLATEDGLFGTKLLDEITVVVFSEMGRSPLRNSFDGKDHFTYTSALMMGSGVAGGTMVGDTDDYGVGETVDLETGQPHATGEPLDAKHLGATLLHLGDAPKHAEMEFFDPIGAAID